MAASTAVPRHTTELTDGWHVCLGDRVRFECMKDGSTVQSVTGRGLGEFDSFVRRFAPSNCDDSRIRLLIEKHLRGISSLAYRLSDESSPGVLVGASYKTTIEEILGAVWEACCRSVVRDMSRAGIESFALHCDHATVESVSQVLLGGVGGRRAFVDAMDSALADVSRVVARG